MLKIRRDDTVQVICGKDRGKTGKVLKVFSKQDRVVVEGINFAKKHMRKTRDDQQAGIIKKESPFHISNVQLVCKSCNRAVRFGISTAKDGTKLRVCKRCKQTI